MNHQAEAVLLLSKLEEQEGNYRTALAYHQENRHLQASLADQNRSEAFEEKRARYKTSEMEQEIELLQQEQDLQQAELTKISRI